MRKIPTLFVRDFEHDNGRYVTTDVTPGCEWVLVGGGVATRKWDGTAVLIDDAGAVWVRREVKAGKSQPPGFLLVEHDDVTGKDVGWEPFEQSGRASVIKDILSKGRLLKPGTYELVGPSINGNPDGFPGEALVEHGDYPTVALDRSHDGLRRFLLETHRHWEGIVFWAEPGNLDAPLAKIKARDFRR